MLSDFKFFRGFKKKTYVRTRNRTFRNMWEEEVRNITPREYYERYYGGFAPATNNNDVNVFRLIEPDNE